MNGCEGVILAAGLGRRAGGFKMELPLGDKTVIQASVEGMSPFASRILVVVGWRAQQVHALLAGYGNVEIVVNDDYQAGMFSSVQAGIAGVRAERFFLLPGDHPMVAADTYRRLLGASGEIVIPICQGRKGHPVRLDSRLIPEILSLSQQSTLRDYIASKGYQTVEVDDRGILIDIDTPEDYRTTVKEAHK